MFHIEEASQSVKKIADNQFKKKKERADKQEAACLRMCMNVE